MLTEPEINIECCYEHAEPILYKDNEHKCRRAFVGQCSNCKTLVDLNRYFLCVTCFKLLDRNAVTPKWTLPEMLESENSLRLNDLGGIDEPTNLDRLLQWLRRVLGEVQPPRERDRALKG